MHDVVIQPVATARQRASFLELPWKLYRGDPLWMPPLRRNQRELAGFARHPFYEQAESQAFLAVRGSEPVGRVSAIINHAHNRAHGENRGFFGFFEAENDPAVATALLEAARKWLAARGMRSLRGPMSPSFNYEMGCLVEGFHRQPAFMMGYNPPYYGPLLEGCGLRKSQDLYAFWARTNIVATLDEKIVRVAEAATDRLKLKFRHLDPRRFDADVRTFLHIHNEANRGHWGFLPLSEGEIRHLSRSLRYLIEPRFTALAEVDGRPIGVMFGILDYNPRIKHFDGRLLPFGFLGLLLGRRQIKGLRIISALVLPEFQLWGVAIALIHFLRPQILSWGIEHVECSWVAESNPLSTGTLERFGMLRDRVYRIYDGDLG
jgi:hypothetical protein